MYQIGMRDYEYSLRKKKIRQEEFLDIMNEILPWDEWVAVIVLHYPRGIEAVPRKSSR